VVGPGAIADGDVVQIDGSIIRTIP
jgi:hypothetical protein